MNENTDIGDAAILTLPVVALRDIIVFPHMTVNLDIGRKESIEAVRAAGRSDRYLAMIMQRDGKVEVPQEEDLYSFGTVVKVKQMLQLPGGLIRIQAEGISRIRVHSVLRKENCLVSQVEDVPEIEPSDALRGEAYRRALLKSFFEWIHNAQQNLSDEQMEQLKASDTPGYTADFISTQMPISPARRQAVLEENDVMERLVLIRRFLDEEIQIGRLEAEINGEVRSRMEKEQRDYYLRQKIKSIHDRLGDEISQDAEAEEYRQKLEKSGIPDEYKKKLEKEIAHLATMPPMMAETTVARNYLEWIFSLPWKEESKDLLDLKKQRNFWMKTITALQKLKNVSLSTLLSASLLRKQRRLSSALWDRPVSVRPALPALLPVRWTKNSPVFLWAVSMMKLKSAGTAAPTSVPCRGASSKPLPMQKQKIPFFFWMKSIKWALIFAAILLRRSWKRSIRNKTRLSTIITLISPSICQKCFS